MRKMMIVMTALSALGFGSSALLAQDAMIKGEITKVDEAQGKMTIQHDAIKKFDMDAMTMIFTAGDPAMLKTVKVGDKVMFNVDKVNGKFTVTKLEKAK